jgi:hypothetical protein
MTAVEFDDGFQETPIWDSMVAERGGRGPAEFEGHESWDDSEEAWAAIARGEKAAAETAVEWLGWDANKPREWGPPAFPAPEGQPDKADDHA